MLEKYKNNTKTLPKQHMIVRLMLIWQQKVFFLEVEFEWHCLVHQDLD